MLNWIRFSRTGVLTALVVGAVLLPWLAGCGNENSVIYRAIDLLRGESYVLSEEGARELARYRSSFDAYATEIDTEREFRHFRDAFLRVQTRYVREVTSAQLVDAAIDAIRNLKAEPHSVPPADLVETALDGMMTALDPHSTYLNAQEFREIQVATKGEFGGLGIQVTMENDLIKIIAPIEDTPAFQARLKSGDLITHLDGDSVKGKRLADWVRVMRGSPGTSIVLTIQRDSLTPFDVAITREIIQVKAVRWRREGDVGYLRVTTFNAKVHSSVSAAISEMRTDVTSPLVGMVLDLRGNGGGLLEQSRALADAFLEEGRIVSVRGRNRSNEQNYDARAGDLTGGLPLVVLINGGSASASEIVASALQDNGRATVMGTQSFGKGSVQSIAPLPTEGGLKLTTALFYAPSGRTIQASGVEPDFIVTKSDKTKRDREADRPNALPAGQAGNHRIRATVKAADCPAADAEGKDRDLGCALAFLRAGSSEKFLSALRSAPAK